MMSASIQQLINRIQQFQQIGNLTEAERIGRDALLTTPNSPELLSAIAVVASQAGRHDEALTLLQRATDLAPDNYIHLFNLGSVYAAKEQFQAAEACFRKVLSISSALPEGFFNLGNSLKDQGRLDDAVIAYRKALQLRSSYAAAWSNLGSAYIQLTKLADAKTAIKRALALNPKSPSALNNLANISRNEGDLPGALQHAVNALAINPNFADAYFTLGSALIASLDYKQGILAYEKVAALKPASKSVLFELVNAYGACGSHAGIVSALERLLQADPHDARAQLYLGITQMERGFYDEASRAFAASLESIDNPAARIRQALTIPPIVGSAEEIREIRQRLDARLDELLDQPGLVADPYSSQLGPNFFLAYHGVNNRLIQSKIARLYRKYAPSLNFVAPHCNRAPQPKPRIRVGFVSKYIYRHSVAISFGSVVSALSEMTDLELFLISTTGHNSDSVKEMYSDYKGTFVCIPTSLPYAQQGVAALELDALVYLDLGMDPFTFLLAFARLAPAQYVMGGHPDTTGIDTVDYFLSSKDAEVEDSDHHYSEKLVRLAAGGFNFQRPKLPSVFKARTEVGFPTGGNIYFCPMMLQKLHPDFDAAISRILQLDETGYIVLCESFQHPRWGDLIRKRLDMSVDPAVRQRVLFIPWIHNSEDFASAIENSSVILDPFHFGIGTTGALTLALGKPLVTMPGEFVRGRVGFLFCKLMGTLECVAATVEDYANKAVAIAQDQGLRESLSSRIRQNNHLIFENSQSADELAVLLKSIAMGDTSKSN
jgi:protein O-GlcNAc transferase